MKELSIEEKAKAYDEVRDKIALRFGANVAKEIFSQFEESKDERIRKIIKQSLKSYFEGKLSIGTNDVDYAMCLSWLKKQGEQKPAWSEEDERMYKAISIALSLNDAKGYLKSWYKTPEEADNWLKSLKERVQPQPKQEWSEEDERTLKEIFSVAARASLRKNPLFGVSYDYIKWQKFLKSLRPQNGWKPTDEQIMVLAKASETYCDRDKNILYSLYNDLKKLRED